MAPINRTRIMHRYTGLDFEFYVAKFYANKVRSAADRKLDFNLTISDVKKMLAAKYCALSGLLLSHAKPTSSSFTDVTIDRLDNSLGYVKGNCIPVAFGINQFKSIAENGNSALTFSNIVKLGKSIEKSGLHKAKREPKK